MAPLIQHAQVVREALEEVASLINRQHENSANGVESECVFDDGHGHYLLVKVGWAGGRRVRATTLHLRTRNGKIWIEEDMTENGIAESLIRRGVRKEEIVLAFQSPDMRRHTEFAVA